ncbi:MAG: molybdenum cofactor guanylyltransferase [Kofleriaceae bacterium]
MRADLSIGALILAGGRATRMGGIAKHAIVVGGETILARQLRVIREHTNDILVSSPVDIDGVHAVRDATAHEGIGPLAGIAAGLAATTAHWMFVIAGDMPYISGMLMGQMLELVACAGGRSEDDHAPTWSGVHAIGVKKRELPEPLFSVLRVPRARTVVAAMIEARDFKASRLLDALGASYIPEKLARACDPDLLTLHNINEPGDIRTAPLDLPP